MVGTLSACRRRGGRGALGRPPGTLLGVACSSSAGTDQSDCSWINFSNFHEKGKKLRACEALGAPEGSRLAVDKRTGLLKVAAWQAGPVAPEEAAGADSKLVWPRRVRAGLPGAGQETQLGPRPCWGGAVSLFF